MKKIGVITIYRKNYGAFLQAFALQKSLLHMGYDTELIRYDYYKDRSILGVPLAELAAKPCVFLKKLLVEMIRFKQHKERSKVFQKSIEKNLKESIQYYDKYSKLEKNPPRYDVVLTGSDQVFSPFLSPHAKESRLLCFSDAVKISYAASSGTVAFPEEYEHFLIEELEKFQAISVREADLRDFLSEKLNREVNQNIDPTLLLRSDGWAQFSEIPSDVPANGQYIAYYCVGQTGQLKEKAEELSKQTGLPVLTIDGNQVFLNQIVRSHFYSPEEWVGAIKNAAYVVTNSFHGTAFSVNFRKKALIVLPERNQGRIMNLLNACKLQRLLEPEVIQEKEIENIYAHTDCYLESERERAYEYLRGVG